MYVYIYIYIHLYIIYLSPRDNISLISHDATISASYAVGGSGLEPGEVAGM